MPANTPNRIYPYPVPGDPTDVPGDLERFAVRVDADLRDLENESVPRAMAQFLGTITNTVPGVSTSGPLTWQLTDYNTVPVNFTDRAVVPVTDATTTALRVNYTGYWYIGSSVQIGTAVSGDGIDMLGVEILRNGGATPANARTTTHDVVFPTDSTHVLDVSCGLFLNAGDTVGVRGLVGRSAGTAPARFERRSITLLRMTRS